MDRKKSRIDLDKAGVCRYLGYDGHAPSGHVSSLIDSLIVSARELIEPAWCLEQRTIETVEEGRVSVGGGLVLASETIGRLLAGCTEVVIYLATIGRRLEEEVSRLMSGGQALDAMILDAIGSEAAEKAADAVQSAVESKARESGLVTTSRHSPGCCGWDVAQQRVLFQAVSVASLGVSLTESCLMVPRKSTSGVIGLFSSHIAKISPCYACDEGQSCRHRRLWKQEIS